MIKAVIDTNVIVSSHLNKDSLPGRILEKIYGKEILPVIDERIFQEYGRVLKYEKFGFDKVDMEVFMFFLRQNAEFISGCRVLRHINLPADDAIFLETAIAAKVKFLITGNSRHFNFKEFAGCRIVNPAEFIKLYP